MIDYQKIENEKENVTLKMEMGAGGFKSALFLCLHRERGPA